MEDIVAKATILAAHFMSEDIVVKATKLAAHFVSEDIGFA
jgi:hypothetical protein